MAYDPEVDTELCALDASHLFQTEITQIGFRKSAFLRGYMYDFISQFAPHLTKEVVEQAMVAKDRKEIDKFFEDIELPSL